MLIPKKYSPNDIISIKLVTGEEVLAKFIEDTFTEILVAKPVILAQSPSGGIAAVPFMVTVERTTDLSFSKAQIISVAHTSKSFADQYIKITTGLQVAKESDLVL